MLALQNFILVVVLPIVTMTGIAYLFRWWMKRSTGYDPLGNKDRLRPTETDSQSDRYAAYIPPKWSDDTAKEE